jgi:hypothetical protein
MPRISSRERATPIIPGERKPPPEYFGDEETRIWNDLVAQMSDDRVNDVGAQILLPLLVVHISLAQMLNGQIKAMIEGGAMGDPKRFRVLRQLLRNHGQESTQITALCRALRLTAQSKRYDRADLRTANTPRPWEDWGH